ncbi:MULTISPECIES: ATP-binding protein [Streptomyces]|uniref:ATP-binding protein n=1 Tax=Streptomyces TaxID=1883 RepID=UPI0019298A88|nr:MULTISPECIES: ATP-binding protein [unclassified Streptomyces]CAD5959719.1 ATP-binding protein [Streptomyces sp. KY75]CAD5980608.1 ATP-binding protein [Streptomyces sp. KY70]
MNQEILRTQHPSTEQTFSVLLSPTRRGARLARLLTVAHLGAWGLSSETAAQIVGELAANASVHGRVQGRDFQLSLAVSGQRLRIEVTDTRGDSVPPGPGAVKAPEDDHAENGRGLLIVEALADHWGVVPGPVPRKTVWAEIDLVR